MEVYWFYGFPSNCVEIPFTSMEFKVIAIISMKFQELPWDANRLNRTVRCGAKLHAIPWYWMESEVISLN